MTPKSSSNGANKIKKRSNSNNAADDYVPSPFELAQTAIALCQLQKVHYSGTDPQPQKFFQQARKLMAEADSYLQFQIDWKEHAANVTDVLFALFPKGRTFSFVEILETSGEKSKGKKPRTSLGAITTENGLKKAIRRYFPKSEAAQMIKGRTMTGNQRNIMMAKRSASREGVARRVKGLNSKNNQAG